MDVSKVLSKRAREIVKRYLLDQSIHLTAGLNDMNLAYAAERLLEIEDADYRHCCGPLRLVNCALKIQGKPLLPPMTRKQFRSLREHVSETKATKPKKKKKKGWKFRNTGEWKRLRYMALVRSNGCCDCCGTRAGKGKSLHVDHIKPKSLYPELALRLSNLQVLCPDCNEGKSDWDDTNWRDMTGAQAEAAE